MIRLYETTFTVPAGTALAAPVVAAVALEDATLDTVRIVVPDGHNGLTGLQVRWNGTQIIPYGTGTWIVANDEVMDVGYAGEITESGLQVAGYNTDLFAHSFYLRWQVEDLAAATPVTISSPQAAGPAGPDTSGVGGLTSATLPANALPDLNPLGGDTGLAVPDVPLPDVGGQAAAAAAQLLPGVSPA